MSRSRVRTALRVLWVAWLLVAVVCLLALVGAMPAPDVPSDVRRTPLPDRCLTETAAWPHIGGSSILA